jgi:hypothetical protein
MMANTVDLKMVTQYAVDKLSEMVNTPLTSDAYPSAYTDG